MKEFSNIVSIIIPVFNRKDIVFETIDSVKKQTYFNWELIIVDDGSNDGTYEILNHALEKEPKIFLYKRDLEPKGAPTCRNIGVRKSRGKYIIFLDSDDILAPTCLEERLHYISQYPHLDYLVFPAFIYHKIPGDTRILWNIDKDKDDLARFLDLDAPWQTSCIIWKYEALMKNGYWDERLSSWQDMDFHTRALIKKLSYKKINKHPDFYYRLDNIDKISSKDKEVQQFYSRIKLGENIYKNLSEVGPEIPEIYKVKLKQFFMWICYSFIKKKHFDGIMAVIQSLYKLKIINGTEKVLYEKLMQLNYYFYHTSYIKKAGRWIKNIWFNTLYKYFFEKIPPKDSTVKLIKYKSKVLKENF